MIKIPDQPPNSFRIELNLTNQGRMDAVLMEELRKQDRNTELKNISRRAFKELFKSKRIQIKGQNAVPSSRLVAGVTYVDILGFSDAG